MANTPLYFLTETQYTAIMAILNRIDPDVIDDLALRVANIERAVQIDYIGEIAVNPPETEGV